MSQHINRNDPGQMPRYHVTNAAAEAHIKAEAWLLCAMWEDSNLEAWEDAETIAHWLEKVTPGVFVLVDTWDNVTAKCPVDILGRRDHWDCDYYYPDYQLFLVPRTAWERVKDACAEMWDAHQAEHQCQKVAHHGAST